ncbi:MAG TPA: TonB-dependent receptor [Gemmatirosa sp.]|nr:TonB-dependent receptor [Gemmatirosa sp.]
MSARPTRPTVLAAVLALSGAALPIAEPASAQRAPAQAAAGAATLRGRVDTPAGAPLADVMIVARAIDAGAAAPRGTTTDEAGRYVLPALPAGRWMITARRLGLAEQSRELELRGDATADFALAARAALVAPVVVSATRETQRRVEASATIDVLDGAEVRLARAAHPAQVMKRVPGVYVSQLSGEGSSVAMRQPITTKPMYLYLEDGIPTRATGFFNHNALYEVNLPQSGGLEVLKGPGTALYGSDAIGGVVNVLTRPAPAGVGGEIATEGGSYGYGRLLASLGGTRGRDGLRADLNLTRMDGWRRANAYERQSATVRWDHFGDDGLSVRTVVTGTLVDQNDAIALDAAGFAARSPVNRSPLAYRRVRALRASSAVERQGERGSWSVTPYARSNVLEVLPNWQLTFDPQQWDTRNTSLGLLLKARRDLAVRGEGARRRTLARVIGGVDLDLSPGSFRADSLRLFRTGAGATTVFDSARATRPVYDYDVTYRQAAPYAQLELEPLPRLRLDVGARWDVAGYAYRTRLAPTQTGRWRVPGDTTLTYARLNPKLGATYELSEAVALFGSWRQGFRAPGQGQLFQQGTAVNTTGLAPVTVASSELGVRGQLGRRVLYQLSAYDMTIADDIMTYTRPDGLREARNAGRTRHRGVETSLGAMLLPSLKLDVAYSVSGQRYVTYVPQAARPATATQPALGEASFAGRPIEQAPTTLGNALLTWSPRLLRGGRVAMEYTQTGRYVMGYDVNALNQPTTPVHYAGHQLWNVHLNAQVTPRAELFARVLNLADRNHAEVASFNANDRVLPYTYTVGNPRTLYAGLRYSR